MTREEEFITMKLLQLKLSNAGLPEVLLENFTEEELQNLEVKNVCVKMPSPYVDSMDEVCQLMNVSKTTFMTNAVTAFITQFWEIEGRHKVLESIGAYDDE